MNLGPRAFQNHPNIAFVSSRSISIRSTRTSTKSSKTGTPPNIMPIRLVSYSDSEDSAAEEGKHVLLLPNNPTDPPLNAVQAYVVGSDGDDGRGFLGFESPPLPPAAHAGQSANPWVGGFFGLIPLGGGQPLTLSSSTYPIISASSNSVSEQAVKEMGHQGPERPSVPEAPFPRCAWGIDSP